MRDDIQPAEDQWIKDGYDQTSIILQGICGALIVCAVVSTIIVQTFKYGQRHPDPAHFVTYAAAIDLANERELFGKSTCK